MSTDVETQLTASLPACTARGAYRGLVLDRLVNLGKIETGAERARSLHVTLQCLNAAGSEGEWDGKNKGNDARFHSVSRQYFCEVLRGNPCALPTGSRLASASVDVSNSNRSWRRFPAYTGSTPDGIARVQLPPIQLITSKVAHALDNALDVFIPEESPFQSMKVSGRRYARCAGKSERKLL